MAKTLKMFQIKTENQTKSYNVGSSQEFGQSQFWGVQHKSIDIFENTLSNHQNTTLLKNQKKHSPMW